MSEVVWRQFEGCEALESARGVWERALMLSARSIPDIHPHRFLATERSMGERSTPYLAVGESGAEPVALIAGRIVRSAVRLRVGYATAPTPRLRSLLTVYGGLAAKPGSAGASAIAEHLRSMLRTGRIGHVRTTKLDVRGEEFAALSRLPGVVRQETERHWVTELTPGSFEETLKRTHSGKHRRNLRRLDRRLMEAFDEQVEVEVVTRGDQVEAYQRATGEIWSRTYKASLSTGQVDSAVWDAILRAEAEAGRLRCYLMRGKGRAIAYHSGFVCDGVFWSSGMGYLPEHAPLRPGTVLTMRTFEDLCAQGACAVDWGFGDAEYKQIVGTDSRDEAMLHLYGRGARATATRWLDCGVVKATTHAKRLMGSKAMSSVKKRWRERLQKRRRPLPDADQA